MDGPHWVVDVVEVPAQYALNNGWSHHQVTARGLNALLKRAPAAIHCNHPDSPHSFGRQRTYVSNGSLVDRIKPSASERDRLQLVWVGSPRLDRGGTILFDALQELDIGIDLDIYGHEDAKLVERLDTIPEHHTVTHYGRQSHDRCLRAIETADIGYCVLPDRSDWRYAAPIKVGEYLAGGTIPLVSPWPGSAQMASGAGRYIEPTGSAIADALATLSERDELWFERAREQCQERAEQIAWSRLREEFATDVLLAAGQLGTAETTSLSSADLSVDGY
jgi:glycosyltransferase involved in cell wall biosynthesis